MPALRDVLLVDTTYQVVQRPQVIDHWVLQVPAKLPTDFATMGLSGRSCDSFKSTLSFQSRTVRFRWLSFSWPLRVGDPGPMTSFSGGKGGKGGKRAVPLGANGFLCSRVGWGR